ncbi:hypothetical protein OIO90_003558 [Microbotryomycetes sp. JL221]|nr:hypothetical protein OIO90_003558 [Microbotryomycetes sp. JL221]
MAPFPSNAPESPPRKSRNDLFSFDWSPLTPNVASRSSTPPTVNVKPSLFSSSEAALSIRPELDNAKQTKPSWRTEERERELKERQIKLAQQSTASNGDSLQLPPTPPSPADQLGGHVWPDPSALPPPAMTPWPLFTPGSRVHQMNRLPMSPVSPEPSSSTPTNARPTMIEHRSNSSSTGSAHGSFTTTTAGISDNPVLDSRQAPQVRLMPNRDYSLGEGRHATVYLASFLKRTESLSSQTRQAHPRTTSIPPSTSSWQLCAAKRVFPDRESQVAGLGEAFILAKLATPTHALRPESLASRGSPHVLKLYGVRDERDGIEPVPDDDRKPPRQTPLEAAATAHRLREQDNNHENRPMTSVSHSDLRTTMSETSNLRPSKASKWLQRRSLRRKSSFTPCNLEPPIGSPSLETSSNRNKDFFATLQEQSIVPKLDSTNKTALMPAPTIVTPESVDNVVHRQSNTQIRTDEYPRLILLLEYCPFGHSLNFARLYPERMGRKRWFEWARQLVAAVAWAHERNVLHADIKPQNVMIASDMTVRLADFGMSMFIPPPESNLPLPSDPHGLGTPPYSPPEFVKALPSPFGFESDVFSLGVTLSVLISGHEPFENMRSVERMLYVTRGGYWNWEDRRRRMSDEEAADSGAVSRTNSIKSIKSTHGVAGATVSNGGGLGRSRAGSAASRVSLNAAQATFDSRSGMANGRPGSLRRTDSNDSIRSNASNRAHPTTLAVSAMRLLADEAHIDGDETDVSDPSPVDGKTSSLSSDFAAQQAALLPFMVVPPPSPPASDAHDSIVSQASDQDVVPEHAADDNNVEPETYADGTPVVYFLNQVDIVPYEVRRLLQAMTSPKESARPTAVEVLRALDELSARENA